MVPNDLHFLARQERYKDLRREVTQQRLADAARDHRQQHRTIYQVVVSWINFYLKRGGSILEPETSTCCEA